MRWFSRRKKSGSQPPAPKGAAPRPGRTDRKQAKRGGGPDRRERYSGWNDPDLPTYGDPFDG